MQQNLSDFFRDLLDWEEQQYSELIHPWDCDLRDSIRPYNDLITMYLIRPRSEV
jgi:hypothetical protein